VRRFAAVAGALLAIPALPLALLAATTPVSAIGFLYVLGALVTIAGLVTASLRRTRRRGVTRAGLALLATAMLVRLIAAGHGRTVAMTRGGSASAPLLDRLLPEADVAVTSARAVILTGMLPANDTKNLVPTLKRAFATMNEAEGSAPSPVVMTTLNGQNADAFDTLEVSAPTPDAHTAVLFLHGYGGNFTLQCWMIAQAARRAGAATFCPSTRLSGDWWSAAGREIVRATMGRLRQRGFDTVVLAGLSNGAVGASRIAPALHGSIVGLLLVSGAASDAPPAGVRTLAIEGSRDTMMSPRVVRQYAEQTGAEYVDIDGTHFLLIEQPDMTTDAMGRWLAARFPAGREGGRRELPFPSP
jgi:pimeloyl-ACP methyl ester carboxylesterase